MVHFGRTIEQQREEEWEAGYVDYKELKRTLSEMIAAGNIQEFSEDTVYSPVSVATYHQVLQPKGPREQDFLAQIDSEIEKVNVFTQGLHAKLEQKLAKVQQRQQASFFFFSPISPSRATRHRTCHWPFCRCITGTFVQAWVRKGSPQSESCRIIEAVDDISDSLQKFENYVNLNYMAFSKILKKHDKFSTCHCLQMKELMMKLL